MNRTLKRLALPAGAALILGTTGFAFMSSNEFSSTPGAGDSSVHASGYNISAISGVGCDSSVNAPGNEICYFSFDAAALHSNEAAPATASIRFDHGRWYTCTAASDYSGARPFTCDLRNSNGQSSVTSHYYDLEVSVFG